MALSAASTHSPTTRQSQGQQAAKPRAQGGGGGGQRSPARLSVKREVSSADSAIPSSPLYLSGASPPGPGSVPLRGSGQALVRGNSLESAGAWNQQQRQPGGSGNGRPRSFLPPLSPQRQRGSSLVDGDADAQSVHSFSASDGQLVSNSNQRRAAVRAGNNGRPPLPSPTHQSGGRLILPAMPGAPSVNRGVLSGDGDSVSGGQRGPLEVNASRSVVKKKKLAQLASLS